MLWMVYRINRNIVECKFVTSYFMPHSVEELIETLWNVNRETPRYLMQGGFRINRNIVECKSSFSLITSAGTGELIETLWNVNSEVMSIKDEYTAELIETLWNVNAYTSFAHLIK